MLSLSWIKHHLIINQRRVLRYFEENNDTLIPVYLPTTASPEFMVLGEVWNISKPVLLVLKYYASFGDFKNKICRYFRILEQKDSLETLA